jgi:hypothetical protein
MERGVKRMVSPKGGKGGFREPIFVTKEETGCNEKMIVRFDGTCVWEERRGRDGSELWKDVGVEMIAWIPFLF